MITHHEGRSKLRPTMKALLAALIGGWDPA
jgi:hypothetical protein